VIADVSNGVKTSMLHLETELMLSDEGEYDIEYSLQFLDPIKVKQNMVSMPEEWKLKFSPRTKLADHDVKLRVEEPTGKVTMLYAHHEVLTKMSKYFHLLLDTYQHAKSDTDDNLNLVTIQHFKLSTVESVLEFMYHGKLSNKMPEDWLELQDAAKYFQLDALEIRVVMEYITSKMSGSGAKMPSESVFVPRNELDAFIQKVDNSLSSSTGETQLTQRGLLRTALRVTKALKEADMTKVGVVTGAAILAYYGSKVFSP
jgi:hypothetical protein